MKTLTLRKLLAPLTAAILLTLCSPAPAQTLVYFDNFTNYFNGNQNADQANSGLPLSCCGGELPGWVGTGPGMVYAVNLNGQYEYATMLWENCVLTMSTGIVANVKGTGYQVSFGASAAVYADPSQDTTAADALVISVLRTNGTVLVSNVCHPGPWTGNMSFTNYAFNYVGDGTGPVELQVSTLIPNDTDFSGALNFIAVTNVGAASAPIILTQPVGAALTEGDDFAVSVVGNAWAETYQWLLNGTPISGATAASFSINDVRPINAGNYTVLVGNPVGTATSTVAVLTVTPAPVYATYQDAVLADKPIHYYPLNDTSGTTAANLGSQPSAGTYNGGVTLGQPTGEPSIRGFSTCALFDGKSGTYVDLGTWDPSTNGFTAEAWVNLDTTAPSTTWYDVLGRVNPTTTGAWILDYSPGYAAQFTAWNASAAQAPAITPFPATPGQWHHFAGVFDPVAGINTVFVDGVQGPVVATAGFAGLGPGGQLDMIGASRGGTTAFPGLIAQAAVYNTALSPAQIRTHFRTAVPPAPPLAIEQATILSWPNLPLGFVLKTAPTPAGPFVNYTGFMYKSGNYTVAPIPVGVTNVFKLFGTSP